jgi:hypothetical protein
MTTPLVLLAIDGAEGELADRVRGWGYEVATDARLEDGVMPRVAVLAQPATWSGRRNAGGGGTPPTAAEPLAGRVEMVRRIAALRAASVAQIILLAVPGAPGVLDAVAAGITDYLVQPIVDEELRIRLALAIERDEQRTRLAAKAGGETAAGRGQLPTHIPMCSYCKSVRDHQNHWHEVDAYVSAQTGAQFSHGVCPRCITVAKTAMERELDR